MDIYVFLPFQDESGPNLSTFVEGMVSIDGSQTLDQFAVLARASSVTTLPHAFHIYKARKPVIINHPQLQHTFNILFVSL